MQFELPHDDNNGEAIHKLKYDEYLPEKLTDFLKGLDNDGEELDTADIDWKQSYLIGLFTEYVTFFIRNQNFLDNNDLAVKASCAQTKASLDKVIEVIRDSESERDIFGAFGHTLGHAFNGFEELIENKSLETEKLPEAIRKILEFTASFNEAIGQFGRAYQCYKYSYPEKYIEKIDSFKSDREPGPAFSAYPTILVTDEDGVKKIKSQRVMEMKEKFFVLINEIKDEPFMKINAEEDAKVLAKKCLEIVNMEKHSEN